MPALTKDEFKAQISDSAVQKGRIPRSPLEGSLVENGSGWSSPAPNPNITGLGSLQNTVSAYTNLLLRAENLARQQYQQFQVGGCHTVALADGGDAVLVEFSTRILFNFVEWARNVPFFAALPATDQMALLRSSWSELFILSASQYSASYEVAARCILPTMLAIKADDSTGLAKRFGEDFSVDQESFKTVNDLVEKFKSIQTDAGEFSCLKALVLFNPDSPGIGNPLLIESLQDKAQAALEEYLQLQHSYASHRFGKLLLRLPALRLIRPASIESLFFARIACNATIDSLVGSILMYGNVSSVNQASLACGQNNGTLNTGYGLGSGISEGQQLQNQLGVLQQLGFLHNPNENGYSQGGVNMPVPNAASNALANQLPQHVGATLQLQIRALGLNGNVLNGVSAGHVHPNLNTNGPHVALGSNSSSHMMRSAGNLVSDCVRSSTGMTGFRRDSSPPR